MLTNRLHEDTDETTADTVYTVYTEDSEDDQQPMTMTDRIEELFSCAEPRLRWLAHTRRIAPDAVEDVVQETLLEAWKSLDHLRDETRFAAWLDGICRNVCLRYQRKEGLLRARETTLQPISDTEDDEQHEPFAHLADPDSFDPVEELTRQDMVFLLDRALGYLSPASRAIVERHYLAGAPQRELAAQMGLSLSAVEARLHRARGQMLHTFSHELRDEALALGLAVAPADLLGWRETPIACFICGQAQMLGLFEPMPDGRVNLRLRCPACQPVIINSLGIVDLAAARSFLPAAKKIVSEIGRYFLEALAAGGRTQCWVCQQPTTLRIMRNQSPVAEFDRRIWLQSSCGCISSGVFALSPYGPLPQVRDFIFGSGPIIALPDVETTYAGQDAMCFGLLRPADGRRLSVFADTPTLLPLAVIPE